MITKNVSIEDFLNEVAYHEASHFVFQQLIVKDYTEFIEPSRINVCVKEEEPFIGQVDDFLPDVFPKGIVIDNKIIGKHFGDITQFYDNSPQKVYLYCLQCLAGYYSYKFFFTKEENFIGIPKHKDSSSLEKVIRIDYYPLEDAPMLPTTQPYSQDHNSIFFKRLFNIQIFKVEHKFRYINEVNNDLDKAMNLPSIKEAIIYVKNQIVKYNGVPIEGAVLDTLKDEVKRIIEPVKVRDFANTQLIEGKDLEKYLTK